MADSPTETKPRRPRRRAPVIPFPEPELELEEVVKELGLLMADAMRATAKALCELDTKVEALMLVADRPSGTQKARP